MNKNQIGKLMNGLLGVSAFLILAGALFKLEHYPYGNLIFWIGIITSLGLSSIEISRLKKIIKVLEKKSLVTELEVV